MEGKIKFAAKDAADGASTHRHFGDIAYHAILADVPVRAIRDTINPNGDGLAGVDAVNRDRVATIRVPVPAIIGGQARPHSLSATLAWFSPVNPGRKSYRSVRLQILKPDGLATLSVTPAQQQPDGNQTNRGTIYSRRWEGSRAAAVGPHDTIDLVVQRDPDPSTPIDEAVPFGMAVTIEMPGVVGIYDQVRQRLAIQPRQPV